MAEDSCCLSLVQPPFLYRDRLREARTHNMPRLFPTLKSVLYMEPTHGIHQVIDTKAQQEKLEILFLSSAALDVLYTRGEWGGGECTPPPDIARASSRPTVCRLLTPDEHVAPPASFVQLPLRYANSYVLRNLNATSFSY